MSEKLTFDERKELLRASNSLKALVTDEDARQMAIDVCNDLLAKLRNAQFPTLPRPDLALSEAVMNAYAAGYSDGEKAAEEERKSASERVLAWHRGAPAGGARNVATSSDGRGRFRCEIEEWFGAAGRQWDSGWKSSLDEAYAAALDAVEGA